MEFFKLLWHKNLNLTLGQSWLVVKLLFYFFFFRFRLLAVQYYVQFHSRFEFNKTDHFTVCSEPVTCHYYVVVETFAKKNDSSSKWKCLSVGFS